MAAIDLSGVTNLVFDVYASRTGSNLKFAIHDTGGTTTDITPNITSANTWQTINWDISAVSDANKNAVDTFVITVVNADSANTFYVDNFITAVSASVSPATLAMTATLNAVTKGIGVNVSPSTLTITASVQNVVISHGVQVDDAVCTFTLWNPSVNIDSSFTASTLTITGTIGGNTPFLATNILRKGYAFGVTEQITHTKLNNIADTAIWEISNQVAGDMFYYEGSGVDKWKRIPKGTAGQKLTIVDDVPAWN